MSPNANDGCARAELVPLLAIGALKLEEASAMEAHLLACPECREELEALRPVRELLAYWPADVVPPAPSLRDRLAQRITVETGKPPVLSKLPASPEPEWEEVATGISCKMLATDTERCRVSMLVRLAPDTAYPPHTHAGLEELHLLDGELWINERKLYPGDSNRSEPGSSDTRVWSETGCTCVLITSFRDVLT